MTATGAATGTGLTTAIEQAAATERMTATPTMITITMICTAGIAAMMVMVTMSKRIISSFAVKFYQFFENISEND